MPSPFPGMDPFLEDPRHWRNTHARLIADIQTQLNPRLRPNYVAMIEERVYIAGEDDPARELVRVPDVHVVQRQGGSTRRRRSRANGGVLATAPLETTTLFPGDEVHEHRIEVIDVIDRAVVAVIELLSPSNKLVGSVARTDYLRKRQQVLDSRTHWVEIDLLRSGTRVARWNVDCDYLVHVSRAESRPKGLLWPIRLREQLPVIQVPLRGVDEKTLLDLQAVLSAAYENGALDGSVDYRRAPVPPLRPADAAWADKLLRKAGLRRARRAR
jgi:hypothetical protein